MSDTPLLAWGRLCVPTARVLALYLVAMPTPRPRVTKTGIAFMPRPYALYAADLQRRLHAHASERGWGALAGSLVVRVQIEKARPRSTILEAPRGDVDNLAKGVLDAATKTKLFWADDVQITDLFVAKSWGDEDRITLTYNTLSDMEA